LEYRRLGRSGLKVSRLCLGTLNLGGSTSRDDSLRLIHSALGAGINFIDTADYYNNGASEEIVGQAIQGRRDQVVVGTKVFFPVGEGPNDCGLSRYHIMNQVEVSLRRLQTDHIDLLQLHRPDPETPVDETLRAMDDLIRQGKVRYIGTSVFSAWRIVEALWTSDRFNLNRVVSEQSPYCALLRRLEKELQPVCDKYGVGLITFGALGHSLLTGKYRHGEPPPAGSRGAERGWNITGPAWEARLKAVEGFIELAEEKGVPPTQLAVAWVLQNPSITSVIIGPKTVEHVQDSLAALDMGLTKAELDRIDELVPPGTMV